MKENHFEKLGKKLVKNETGSITLFVLIAIIFFLIILAYQHVSLKNKQMAEEKELAKIQKNYQIDDEEMDKIYEENMIR